MSIGKATGAALSVIAALTLAACNDSVVTGDVTSTTTSSVSASATTSISTATTESELPSPTSAPETGDSGTDSEPSPETTQAAPAAEAQYCGEAANGLAIHASSGRPGNICVIAEPVINTYLAAHDKEKTGHTRGWSTLTVTIREIDWHCGEQRTPIDGGGYIPFLQCTRDQLADEWIRLGS
ncbi:hypothetical protein HLB23_25130 [Nocardia uniformis]|uniref:Uncharacterized protein n=1 Tax=Nocardia uniformis TaxID=53432 RepID=A0A849C9Y6_9NOCA|nr:hypothetical protein [Nocardia uniformis]NNH73105.1 hypothetical protein [Nocardia uniformis]